MRGGRKRIVMITVRNGHGRGRAGVLCHRTFLFVNQRCSTWVFCHCSLLDA